MSQFEKGNSCGEGRPKGRGIKPTMPHHEIDAEQVTDRGRLVALNLPPIETAHDIVRAHAAVIAQLAAGELTPEEAGKVSDVLENQRRALVTSSRKKRRALETSDLEKRMQELEEETKGDRDQQTMAA